MSGPFTIYALGNQLYRVDGLEDPAMASTRMMFALGTAEDLVAYSLFASLDDPMETAFPTANPKLEPLHRDIISVDRLSGLLTKKDPAQIYLITNTTTHERKLEPQVDHLQKGANTWKMAHSASMPLSQFANSHVDRNDDPNTLHRIALDVGQYRIVHSGNLARTLGDIEHASNVYPYPTKPVIERCKAQLERVAEIHEENLRVYYDTPAPGGV